ncbi:MAG: hypothetical protein EOM52_10580 [Clostridia bacterium]|nr:hypothetical protein [Clostridia bacterium]
MQAPPRGCDPNTFKLFVGNVPPSFTESHLRPLFETVGRVVEVVVMRDRDSGAHKKSAFVVK